MDMVSCKIQLGADPGNVAVRDPFNPISWPEVAVLQYLHGEESVYDIEYVSSQPSTAVDEKNRLISKYGSEAVNIVFPGSRPNIDGTFPGDRGDADDEPAKAAKTGKTVNPATPKTPAPKGKDTMKQAPPADDEEP